MGTACGRRGGLPRSEWETTNVRGQSSRTFQQIALRRCWSSRTSSRTSVGILSRCQSRSRTRADSASLAKAEAKTALIAYAAAPRSWAATWATVGPPAEQERVGALVGLVDERHGLVVAYPHGPSAAV